MLIWNTEFLRELFVLIPYRDYKCARLYTIYGKRVCIYRPLLNALTIYRILFPICIIVNRTYIDLNSIVVLNNVYTIFASYRWYVVNWIADKDWSNRQFVCGLFSILLERQNISLFFSIIGAKKWSIQYNFLKNLMAKQVKFW